MQQSHFLILCQNQIIYFKKNTLTGSVAYTNVLSQIMIVNALL